MMKTNPVSKTPYLRAINPLRAAMAALCVSMLALLGAPTASAAADGDYTLVAARGKLVISEVEIAVPRWIVRRIADVVDEQITIEDNRLSLNRRPARRLANLIGDAVGLDFDTTVTGPTFVELSGSGTDYSGSTTSPIRVSFQSDGFIRVSGVIRLNVNAEIEGDTLTIRIPIRGQFMCEDIRGHLKLVLER